MSLRANEREEDVTGIWLATVEKRGAGTRRFTSGKGEFGGTASALEKKMWCAHREKPRGLMELGELARDRREEEKTEEMQVEAVREMDNLLVLVFTTWF